MANIKREHSPGEHDEFIQRICDFKHEEIDKKIDDLKDQIFENSQTSKEIILEAIKNTELRLMAELQGKEENLKNKIVVSEKGINEKIDAIDNFQDTLKGNGEPGIKEKIRSLEYKAQRNFIIIGFVLVLLFGGEFWGVTAENIKKYFANQARIQASKQSQDDKNNLIDENVDNKNDDKVDDKPGEEKKP